MAQSVGPGPLPLVLRDVISMTINAAYIPTRVLRELQNLKRMHSSWQSIPLKAKLNWTPNQIQSFFLMQLGSPWIKIEKHLVETYVHKSSQLLKIVIKSSIDFMDSHSEAEDFPVDNLIQELNSFVESCSKNEETIKDSSEHSCKERKACSSYLKQTSQDESNVNSLHSMKNKRKSGIPIKNLKPKNALGLNNERSSFNMEKARKKSKIRRNESDFEEEFPFNY
ncbi:hypothetical protein Avbf_03257 [Armadillidium vulgare]|nr:hypothetical protein Avbf_03257 [Armadillidium vulgare]